MEPKFQIKHRPHVTLQAASLEAHAHGMEATIKRFERGLKAVERRLGRKNITCGHCGKKFHLKDAALRLPPFGNPSPPVAVCPHCEKDN